MQIRTRSRYDTTLIYLFIQNKEHLLAQELVNRIPASTKATWRNYSCSDFFGNEQVAILNEGIRYVELYQKYKRIKMVLKAVQAIYISIAGLIAPFKKAFYTINDNRLKVLDLIHEYKSVIDLKCLLNVFQISRSTYNHFLLKEKIKCFSSFMGLCSRRYGSQLTRLQVLKIKSALLDPVFSHWPICSIAYHFQRVNSLHVSVQSWYKYARRLGIKRLRYKKVKRKNLPCHKPDQYWHLDLTYFITKDNTRHFIYFLVDNFSRKILAHQLAFDVNWIHVKTCIERASAQVVNLNTKETISLITDGGPENTSNRLGEFFKENASSLKHLIALKDITFSNSMVEANHRTFKYYYAVPAETENTKQLMEKLDFYVRDFNTIRPHAALKGFTPDEVYRHKMPDLNFTKLRKTDVANRRITNHKNACLKCKT